MFVGEKYVGREIGIHVFEVGKAAVYIAISDSLI